MNSILTNFVSSYALNMDRKIFSKDAQRNSQSPILFVFIGDDVEDAASFINGIKNRWDNGEGIIFINIGTKAKEDSPNIFNFQFPYDAVDKKLLRKSIRDKFYKDKETLQKFNEKLTLVRDKILCCGELFNSFENLSVSVVARADDPLNILLPDISILIRKRMMEVFKSCVMDLYVLIKEKDVEDEFLSKAFSISFFRELEYIQTQDFKFNEKIAIYGDERELSVETQGPIFYLNYLLEDKNERGVIPKKSMENNYEIISYISLLKNINIDGETYSDVENQYYDNSRFKANIGSNSLKNSKNVYSTAGLAKVKRPNAAVAASTLRAVYENILNKMIKFSNKGKESIGEILKIDEESIQLIAEDLIPEDVKVQDMISIMSSKAGNELYRLTLKEAEKALYDSRCEEFFYHNFVGKAEEKLCNMKLEQKMRNLIDKDIIRNESLGIYCGWKWTLEDGEGLHYIKECKNFLSKNIEVLNGNIEVMYENKALGGFSIKSIFFKDEKVKEIKNYIFSIYEKKLQVLKFQLMKKILQQYEHILIKINKDISFYIEGLQDIKITLNDYEEEVIREQDEYTGQNIKAYYGDLVNKIIENMEMSDGEGFYFEDRYIGNIYDCLKEGKEALFKRLIEFCNKYILSDESFYRPFEEEFNQRANVDVSNSKDKLLSKDELYRKLFDILQHNSAVKAYIMNYDVRAYEEKYLFGDYNSQFIKYAFDFDRKTQSYKIGYVHEKRASGIEKLSLMGGFTAKDVVYIRNAFECYKYCIEKGYELHGISPEKLPEI